MIGGSIYSIAVAVCMAVSVPVGGHGVNQRFLGDSGGHCRGVGGS